MMAKFMQLILVINSIFFTIQSIDCDQQSSSLLPRSECNFKKPSECKWTFSKNWHWKSLEDQNYTLSLNSTPYLSENGYQLENHVNIDNDYILSPIFELKNESKNKFCFDFFYYFMNNDISIINNDDENYFALYLLNNSTNNSDNSSDIDNEIWRTTMIYEDFWHHTFVNFDSENEFQLKFISSSNQSLIAVTDFRLNDKYCRRKRNHCNFETNNCGWTLMKSNANDSNIIIERLKAKNTDSNQSIDHTTSSPNGYVLYYHYMKMNNDTNTIQRQPTMVTIKSLTIQDFKGPKCFQFWLFFSGSIGDVDLRLFEDKDQQLWELSSESNRPLLINEWNRFQIKFNINNDSNYLKFLINHTGHNDNDVSIKFDDFNIIEFNCPKIISCNFVDGICGWKQNFSNNFQWTLGIGRVFNESRLNFRFNNYRVPIKPVLYTDFTRLPLNKNNKQESMQLISEYIHDLPKIGACILINYQIWSFDYDNDEFSLSYQTFNDETNKMENKTIIWKYKLKTIKNDHHDDDNPSGTSYVEIHLPNTNESNQSKIYRLILTAKSSNPSTYILIYELNFSIRFDRCGSYVPNKTMTTATTATATTTTITTIKSTTEKPITKPTFNCTFESNTFCLWTNLSRNFQITNATNTNYNIFEDHTTHSSNGHFAALQIDKYVPYRQITPLMMIRNPFKIGQKFCMEFYYYFFTNEFYEYGSNIQLLLLSSRKNRTLFYGYQSMELKWHRTLIEYEFNNESDYYDIFQFQCQLNDGIIALDDISIIDSTCDHLSKNNNFRYCDFELIDSNESIINGFVCKLFANNFNQYQQFWQIYSVSSIIDKIKHNNQLYYDHTTHTKFGHVYGYLIDVQNKIFLNETTTITIYRLSSTKTYCLRFSYFLTNNITLYYRSSLIGSPISWRIRGTTNGIWFTHQKQLSISNDGNFNNRQAYNLIFGIHPDNVIDVGMAFIDDFYLENNNCAEYNDDNNLCDFENGDICTLELVKSNNRRMNIEQSIQLAQTKNFTFVYIDYLTDYIDRQWFVYCPIQQKNDKFKPFDHTKQNIYGKYLIMNAQNKGFRGIVITERISLNHNQRSVCLKFSLITFGSIIFEIYQGDSSFINQGLKIWDVQYEINDWTEVQIQANAYSNKTEDIFFYLIATGLTYDTDYAAIDDVEIRNSICSNPSNIIHDHSKSTTTTTTSKTSETTTNHTPSPTTKKVPDGFFDCQIDDPNRQQFVPNDRVCNYYQDCSNNMDEKYCGTCSFDRHNLCRYEIEPKDSDDDNNEFKFRFTDQSKYGPNDDYYHRSMTANGIIKSISQTTKLLTPLIHQSYQYCVLEFYYLYKMRDLNQYNRRNYSSIFNIYVQQYDPDIYTKIWQQNAIYNLPPNQWNFIRIKLNRIIHSFRLEFVVYPFKKSIKDYQSIRDISLKQCNPSSKSKVCPNQFRCKNQVCIPYVFVCDFDDDCGDNSDEIVCDEHLRFSFEDGLRNYAQEYKMDKNNWTLHESSSFDDLRSQPTFDHTNNFIGGHFLLAKSTRNKQIVSAIIDSPTFKVIESETLCTIRMFIMKNSLNSTIWLKLWNLKTNRIRILSTINGVFDYVSYLPITTLVRHESNSYEYKLLIEAKLNYHDDNYMKPYVAIDDIIFRKGCQIVNDNVNNITTAKPCIGLLCNDINDHSKQICLPENKICDFIKHCQNGEDEINCGDCNFNNQTWCGWTSGNLNDDNLKYELLVAKNSPNILPKKDFNDSPNGGYLAAYSKSLAVLFQSSIKSPQINAKTSRYCRLRFSYLSNFRTIVQVKLLNNDRIIHTIIGDYKAWMSFETEIGEQLSPLIVLIKTKLIHSKILFLIENFMIIDNIQFIDCNPNDDHNKIRPIDYQELNCDFEEDWCDWIVPGVVTNESWIRTNSPYDEPGIDHTSLIIPKVSPSGYWLSTNSKSEKIIRNQLQSIGPIPFEEYKPNFCLIFWYYFFGIQSSEFQVYIQKINDQNQTINEILWKRTIPNIRKWQMSAIEIDFGNDLKSLKYFYINFDAFVSSNTIIGIDDIQLNNDQCSTFNNEYCDFEINNCDWIIIDDNNVKRMNGNYYNIKDHTTDTIEGHYLVESNYDGNNGRIEKLMKNLPFFMNDNDDDDNIQDFCLNFYYYFHYLSFPSESLNDDDDDEDTKSSINIQLIHRNNMIENITRINFEEINNDKSMNIWTSFTADFRASINDRLIINLENYHPNLIMILDDIHLRPDKCNEHDSCDFEQNMCGWYSRYVKNNNANDNFEFYWLRLQPTNRFVRQNGLEYDHTLHSRFGNYLSLPLDSHQRFNGRIELINVFIKNEQSSSTSSNRDNFICFRLYYFAQTSFDSENVTALRIQVIDNDHNDKIMDEFRANATINELQWTKFEQTFKIVSNTKAYSIQIVVEHTFHINSDIGIDDIYIQKGSCQTDDDHKTLSTTTSTTTKKPNNNENRGNCNFERNCNWKYDHKRWNVTSFRQEMARNIYAPQIDHTYSSSLAHYLLFINGNFNDKTSYELQSPEFVNDKNDRCLELWYYMDGEDVFYLNFYEQLTYGNDNRKLQKLIGRYSSSTSSMISRRWQLIKIDLPQMIDYHIQENVRQLKISYKITFEPYLSGRLFEVFAIDDIVILPKQCGHYHNYIYTFTNGLESNLQFQQLQPTNVENYSSIIYPNHHLPAKLSDVPSFDHTTYQPNGHYFLFYPSILGNNQYFTIDTLQLRNLPKYYSYEICLRFAYQFKNDGNDDNNLNFSIYHMQENEQLNGIDGDHYQPIWNEKYSKSMWTIKDLSIGNNYYESKLIFYMTSDQSSKSKSSATSTNFIAIDDISLLLHKCPLAIDCSFELNTYCSYTKYKDDESNYNFEVFKTPAIDLEWPGPRYDHTLGKDGGSYLFLTDYRCGLQSQPLYAKIISGARKIQANNEYCLEMWIIMNSDNSKLSTTLLRYGSHWNDQNREMLLFKLTNVHHNEWTRIQFTLNNTILMANGGTDEIQIIIDGVLLNGKNGNQFSAIAIDDIKLLDNNCLKNDDGLVCENGVKIQRKNICNFIKDCPSGLDEAECGDCNFEIDMCVWVNVAENKNDIPFERVSVQELISKNSFAPKVDGSGNPIGHFVVMKFDDNDMNDHSMVIQAAQSRMANNYRLKNFYLKKSFKTCMIEFDFYMHLSSVDQENYNLRLSIGYGSFVKSTIYELPHDKQQMWRHVSLNIGQILTPFFVEFDLYQQNFKPSESIFAIDNIQFTKCSWPLPLPFNHVCPNNGILCNQTRICITNNEICDNNNDCMNMEDEHQCFDYRICTFDTSMDDCNLQLFNNTNVQTNVYWKITSGNQIIDRTKMINYEPFVDKSTRLNDGRYLILLPKLNVFNKSWSNFEEFGSPIFEKTSANQYCHLRFFLFMNSAINQIKNQRVTVYVREFRNNNHLMIGESKTKLKSIITGRKDQQQIWTKHIVRHSSKGLFQFIIRGYLEDSDVRIAIDDLSFNLNCKIYKTISTVTATPTEATTISPPYERRKHAGSIIAAIMITICLIIGVLLGVFGYHSCKRRLNLNDHHISTTIFSRSDDTIRMIERK